MSPLILLLFFILLALLFIVGQQASIAEQQQKHQEQQAFDRLLSEHRHEHVGTTEERVNAMWNEDRRKEHVLPTIVEWRKDPTWKVPCWKGIDARGEAVSQIVKYDEDLGYFSKQYVRTEKMDYMWTLPWGYYDSLDEAKKGESKST